MVLPHSLKFWVDTRGWHNGGSTPALFQFWSFFAITCKGEQEKLNLKTLGLWISTKSTMRDRLPHF